MFPDKRGCTTYPVFNNNAWFRNEVIALFHGKKSYDMDIEENDSLKGLNNFNHVSGYQTNIKLGVRLRFAVLVLLKLDFLFVLLLLDEAHLRPHPFVLNGDNWFFPQCLFSGVINNDLKLGEDE